MLPAAAVVRLLFRRRRRVRRTRTASTGDVVPPSLPPSLRLLSCLLGYYSTRSPPHALVTPLYRCTFPAFSSYLLYFAPPSIYLRLVLRSNAALRLVSGMSSCLSISASRSYYATTTCSPHHPIRFGISQCFPSRSSRCPSPPSLVGPLSLVFDSTPAERSPSESSEEAQSCVTSCVI